MKLRLEAFGDSHVGRVRKGNEDAFLADAERGVFLVADGMGGHVAGEIASAIASEAVGSRLTGGVDRGLTADELAREMTDAIAAADAAIAAHVQAHPLTLGMGTTLTACVICDDGTYRLGHIGDSRAYLRRDGMLVQITHDHTWVQREVDEGRLRPEALRRHPLGHVLTRALGTDTQDQPDLVAGRLLPGDELLLCTDGLTGMLDDKRLARILDAGLGVRETVAELIRAANARGGRDNITAVMVRVLD
ncbi:MAG TPA: protein phosphatase 2C domain-containing protein [Longimicrobium sp.]|nr:protein phosphatase 2C domain-containing protein [Longimicrobium sp.]